MNASYHRNYKSVHVAGTNGKGSVTIKIGKGLELAGYRVGVFTSPHIYSFCERIQINGVMISEDDVAKYQNEMITENYSFFERATMLAFKYFSDKKVDWAVFETGLGGRLDATNVITPELSVITSISLDHTEQLGDTLEKIAFEKAGIIKPEIPVVLGPRTPFVPRREPYYEVTGEFETTELENRAVAKKALEVLGVYNPLALEASLPCRMERHDNLIFDVAHNPDGLERLLKSLSNIPLRIVFGMSHTKDLSACMKILKKYKHPVYFVEVPEGRGYTLEQLSQEFGESRYGLTQALEDIQEGETLLVCGSCYIMKSIKDALHSRITIAKT